MIIREQMRRAAARYRRRGFAITWLVAGEKNPSRKGWSLASQEPDGYEDGANLGIMTGRLSGDLVCVDLDSQQAVNLAPQYLPHTNMVDGRDGKPRSHWWYIVTDVPESLTSKAAGGIGGPKIKHFKDADGKPILDFLGTGAQAVVPPSIHASGEQRIWHADGDPARVDMTELWDQVNALAVACGYVRKELPASRDYRPGPRPEQDKIERRAVAYLQKCPPAISGQGGHDRTLATARAIVYGFDLGAERGFELLADHWNPQCQPPWSEGELRHKCEDADRPWDKPRGYLLHDEAATMHQQAVTLEEFEAEASRDREEQAASTEEPAEQKAASSGDAAAATGFTETDTGNAQRLVKQHGEDLRFCHPWKQWLTWRGDHWQADNTGMVMAWAKGTMIGLNSWAMRRYADLSHEEKNSVLGVRLLKLADWARKGLDERRLKAMVSLAQSEEGIPVLPDEMDRDIWALNVSNGTVDLRTGKLRPHRREDLHTRICPVEYHQDATCPTWEQCLYTWQAGNRDVIDYLRRAVGYSLTGDVSEQCLFFLHGEGANGKSTFLDSLLGIWGEYGLQSIPELLMMRQSESHPTERADLFCRRLVATVETEDGRRMAESLVKALTGGDRIRARRMRQDFWEFQPTHKIWLAANHKPVIRGQDHGIWRRIKIVPFTVTIPAERRDPNLAEELRAERPGILAWAVRGCLEWQADGMQEPEEVRQATDAYRSEQDVVGSWIAECCVTGPDYRARARDLLESIQAWCRSTGEHQPTQRTLGQRLEALRFVSYKNNGTWYRGLAVRTEPTEPTESNFS